MRLTITGHAQCQAFLQAAMLTSVAVGSINETIPLSRARVSGIVLLASAKESLQRKDGKIFNDLHMHID